MNKVFILRCVLENLEPPIWRRLELPGELDLEELAGAILLAMGWECTHEYSLAAAGAHLEPIPPDALAQDVLDHEGVSLLLKYGEEEEWSHFVAVEESRAIEDPPFPRCIEGNGACPPDDCGGPEGYTRLLKALEQDGPEGLPFDPSAFDVAEANRRLEAIGSVTWYGGLLQPFGDEEHQMPALVLWVDPFTDEIVGQAAAEPDEWRDTALEILQDALQQADAGDLLIPARLRVSDEELARRVRDVISTQRRSIYIEEAATPELDEMAEDLITEMSQLTEQDLDATDPLMLEHLSTDRIGQLFRAAARLYRSSPWKRFGPSAMLTLSAPELDLPDAVLIVEGDEDRDFTLIILESEDDCRAFLESATQHSPSGTDRIPVPTVLVRTFSFERGASLPKDLRRRIAENQWEVANARAYPSLLCVGPSGQMEQIDDRALTVFIVATEALARLVENHGDMLRSDHNVQESFNLEDLPESLTVSLASGFTSDEFDSAFWSDTFDPNVGPPSGSAWLSLDEDERLALVKAAHSPLPVGHPKLPNSTVHASFHVIVENQLALGDPPEVRTALQRLMNDGLERHDALHAIGFLVAEMLHTTLGDGPPLSNENYAKKLAELTPERWRLLAAAPDDDSQRKRTRRKNRGRRTKRSHRRKKGK